jgi:predicted nucleic acid-binding protein
MKNVVRLIIVYIRSLTQFLNCLVGAQAPSRRSPVDGAAYDALVAATAVAHSAELVTCDRRAASVYESYGVRTIFVT